MKMHIHFNYYILFLLLFFTSGCGPARVNLNILKPAEINIKSIKKIAVLDFDVPQGIDKSIGSEIASKLTSQLVQNNFFKVIERKELAKILNEQGLSQTGVIDASKAQEIGKLLGADALIVGTVNTYTHSDSAANDTIFSVYRAERTGSVDITFRVTDVQSGIIVASKTNRKSEKATTHRSYEQESRDDKLIGLAVGVLTQKQVKSPADKARDDALASLPAAKNLLDRAVENILNSFVAQIAPHYVSENRIIEPGSHKKMKSALEFTKRYMWEDAKNLWEEILQDSNADKDHPAAHYNLGLYYESTGDLNKAEEEFSKAFKLKDKDLYLDSISYIRERKKEQEKLKEQTDK